MESPAAGSPNKKAVICLMMTEFFVVLFFHRTILNIINIIINYIIYLLLIIILYYIILYYFILYILFYIIYIILYYIILYYAILYYIILNYIILYYIILYCIIYMGPKYDIIYNHIYIVLFCVPNRHNLGGARSQCVPVSDHLSSSVFQICFV